MDQLEEVDVLRGVSRHRFVEGVWIEPSPRRVRAWFGGVAVADSRRVLLVYEPRRLPVYWFPVQDVRMDYLKPARHAPEGGDGSATARWDLEVDGRSAENAAWSYPQPDPERVGLKDHVAFYWN